MCDRTATPERIAGMKMIETATVTDSNGPKASSGAPVWVQCPGFRCLAYQDVSGKWRTYSRGEVLADVICVSETTSAAS
jgi:hypothetical protein